MTKALIVKNHFLDYEYIELFYHFLFSFWGSHLCASFCLAGTWMVTEIV